MRIQEYGKISVAVLMAASLIAGCSNSSDPASNEASESNGGQKTVSFLWNGKFSSKIPELSGYGDVEAYKEIQKRTQTTIDFQDNDTSNLSQFNIMLASGTYPDIIYVPGGYPGGVAKLVEDGVAIRLNELIDQYAPNYKKLLDEHPEIKKQVMLDDGTIAKFPQVNLDLRRNAWSGLMIRQDWLDQVGLPMPSTIDEWYAALKAFKDNDMNGNGDKEDEIPLGDQNGMGSVSAFSTAYGLLTTFQIHPQTGKVTYGPYDPAFKDYLATMRKWYEEGLIDSEFAATDKKGFEAKFSNNVVGAYGGTITGINTYKNQLQGTLPAFKLVGTAPPIGPAGKDYSSAGQLAQYVPLEGAVVSSQAKDLETVIKLLDFMIGPEGSDLQNWGIEGKSYVVENGKKKFSDAVMNDPTYESRVAVSRYAYPTSGMVKVMSYDAWAAFELQYPEAGEANERWFNADKSLLLPPLLFKGEESQEISNIMSEADTYMKEMVLKFIMGNEPLDKFDAYLGTLKKMNIERAIAIHQAAYDRYQSR
ncbi:putative aldouronate transport system substrate-binding protein [Paenibacillus phyllosphaerae]|uniref:Putative aldouronate transport system substrate-binding protein n=1 Tax=Paenibacillus phyllosphaerae TaxID=274593 RepID=A0A7W5FQL4_9BACL|nr:extracellular solute-binding protein [Paenibacillus phyllosphaerae]MBB3113367.1 putative aldouronate transport system substrate-binding protein [Paenibacillus phyllosphaerae]